MKNLAQTIDEKVITPLLEAANFPVEDHETIRAEMQKVILAELVLKIAAELTHDESAKIVEKIKGKDAAQTIQILQSEITNSPKLHQAVMDYLSIELPKFISEMAEAYMSEATEDERKTFLQKLNQS